MLFASSTETAHLGPAGTEHALLKERLDPRVRILVADDDRTIRSILAGLFRKWGYEAILAKDGLEAWAILQGIDAPRLVIMDWMMPGLDGLEVIEKVHARHSDLPPYIILLTSRDEQGDILSGLESGANDYIKKPFDHKELYARLRVGLRTIELQDNLYQTQQILEHLATHDPLTGILNRRAILDLLTRELSQSRQRAHLPDFHPLSIGFFDVDQFKHVNDHYGHKAGDEVLCGIVGVLKNELRPSDSFSRLGGDEFLVVAPETSGENRRRLFERLRDAIASARLQTCAGLISITVSIGVASAAIHSNEDQLLSSADAAMYRAKHLGGNCVVYEL